LPLVWWNLSYLQVCLPSLAGYIGEFEFVDNHRSGKIVVELNGRCVAVLCSRQLALYSL
jgi:ribosomal protein S8